MYSGNKEYFELKRQLIDEAKAKLDKLPTERSNGYKSNQSMPNGLTFVYEWCDNGQDILGYGCDSNGNACCLRPNIVPGLFVISSDTVILKHVCAIYGFKIIEYDIDYETNNFTSWEMLQDYNACKPGKLVKILTNTVANADRLYKKFKYNSLSYRYVGIPQYFNIVTQIMFEIILNRNALNYANKLPFDYSIPNTVMEWFDENLNAYKNYSRPNVPTIFYDIETVSSDAHRVPTGDDAHDILFTVSIYHSHTNVLYTLIYMPLQLSSREMEELIRKDGYDVVPNKSVDSANCTNVLECFASERQLLTRTMKLLTLKPKLHFMCGYNSLGYDIKYLLTRCAFFNIELDKFIWREGYCFGTEQLHLDMFRIILMRYRFKSYKLDDVSRELLKDSKTGVNAVNLRYTFFRMYKYNRYFTKEESDYEKPSVRDTLEYNNADTLLVHKLEEKTQCIPFLIRRAMDCQVPLTSMNTNYNKMQYKLWSECFVVGLSLKMFMSTFKSTKATIKCPISSAYSPNDMIDVPLNLSENLNSGASEVQNSMFSRYETEKKASFPGGANFCLGEYNADNVQMYDYVTAYPILMDRKNISDETTTILPASVLAILYPKIQNVCEFKTYDYMAHNGSTKTETIILYYQYIYDGLHCGGEFPFTLEELTKRHDSPVIVIWEGRRGILSRIIAHFSAVRAVTKLKRKTLDEIYGILIEKKNDLITQKLLMDATSDDDDDDDERPNNENDIDGDDFGFDDDYIETEDNFGVEETCDDNFGIEESDDNFGIEESDDNFGIEESDDNFGIEESDDNFGIDENCDDDDNFGIDDCEVGAAENLKVGVADSQTTEQNELFANLPPIVGRIIKMFGNMCFIDDDELNKELDPMSTVTKLAELIALERSNVGNSYDLQKSIVASIYGCVGKMSIVSAAVITSMTRSTLLASAQFCRSLGHKILYIDTDSIMISGCTEDLSSELNRRYPFMEMEMKVARKCMFVKRKTYYKVEDGSFKYGQNVNGPNAWRECIEFFYNRDTITTNPDIYQAFYDFFMQTYKKLTSFDSVTPEFLQCFTQTIKTKDEYKTMTVAKKFKNYLAEKYQAIAGANKHSIFYYLDNSVLLPCLRPDLDIKSVDDLRFVNLFKYFQNMYTTIFNLIKFHIRKNNEPYNVTLSSKYVLLLMLKGFLDAYQVTFSRKAAKMHVNIDDDAEKIFTDPIHTEVLNQEDSL
ncbi:DNApol B [Tomelloso virus]|uniref:DNA polymerase n=1 Tax=Tomelloso virus TaxID=2053981 RepID=A0A2H4T2N0_9VIRU|nr:DNApol B [Tomelloso virus]ATY70177.1 DNApol B [Tomelloso virus]